MKGAKQVVAVSPTGTVEVFEGTNLRIDVKAGTGHWTIHEVWYGDTGMALVGVVPKTWAIRLILP